MEGLANLDQVAYVRYASVYRDFRATADFEAFIEEERLVVEPEPAIADNHATPVSDTEE